MGNETHLGKHATLISNNISANYFFIYLIKLQLFFFTYSQQGIVFHYLIFTILTARAAAPQTALWGGPRPRFEPGTGDLEAETSDHWISLFILY